MGTVADKLALLLSTKNAIRNAIIGKGQPVADTDPFSSYAAKIAAIQTGVNTSDATAGAGDILQGKTAYVNGQKVTGNILSRGSSDISVTKSPFPDGNTYRTANIPDGYYSSIHLLAVDKVVSQATPSISVDSAGKITASATQEAGYVDAGTKSATQQLTTKGASDLTASGATVSVPAGYYPSAVSKSVDTATQATPSISVSSAGEINVSITRSAGYMDAGTEIATKQLNTQAAATITPGTAAKTAVAAGRYTTGDVTVAGDANLKAENIKSGVSIFGVAGSYVGTGSGDSANNAVSVTINKQASITNFSVEYPSFETEIDSITGSLTMRGVTFTTYGAFCILATAKTSTNVINIASITGGQAKKLVTTSALGSTAIFFVLPTSSKIGITFNVTTSGGSGETM